MRELNQPMRETPPQAPLKPQSGSLAGDMTDDEFFRDFEASSGIAKHEAEEADMAKARQILKARGSERLIPRLTVERARKIVQDYGRAQEVSGRATHGLPPLPAEASHSLSDPYYGERAEAASAAIAPWEPVMYRSEGGLYLPAWMQPQVEVLPPFTTEQDATAYMTSSQWNMRAGAPELLSKQDMLLCRRRATRCDYGECQEDTDLAAPPYRPMGKRDSKGEKVRRRIYASISYYGFCEAHRKEMNEFISTIMEEESKPAVVRTAARWPIKSWDKTSEDEKAALAPIGRAGKARRLFTLDDRPR
jgi:hypothetical protein